MRKYILPALVIFTISCSSPTENQPNTTSSSDPTANLSKADSEQYEMVHKLEMQRKSHPYVKEVQNTTSTYRYVTSTEGYKTMGMLVTASDEAKALHGNTWSLLAPTDIAFEKYDQALVKTFLRPEAKKLLNAFVNSHILTEPYSIEKVHVITEVKNRVGKTLKVSGDAMTIGGAQYSGVEYTTNTGMVISMDAPLYFPEAELKAILNAQK